MNKLVTLLLCLLCYDAFSGEIVLKGTYNGANLYVRNPISEEGDYCIDHILINGEYHQPSYSSGFDIDLSFLSLHADVEVKIVHKTSCNPEIINPDVLAKQHTFKVIETDADQDMIIWRSEGEHRLGKYLLLRFEYNTWVSQKSVESKGEGQMYRVPITHHAGANRYKIKYISPRGKSFYSDEFRYFNNRKKATLSLDTENKEVAFSRSVNYMVLTVDGKVMQCGTSDKAPLLHLDHGLYFVNFDNQTEVIRL